MGNGAIVTFSGDPDEESAVAEEELNKQLIRDFYQRVWAGQDPDAVSLFVTRDFTIHRDGRVRHGVEALREMTLVTQVNFDELNIEIEALVALGDMVAYRINVSYSDIVRRQRLLIRGVSMCRIRGDRIAETSVTYLKPVEVGVLPAPELSSEENVGPASSA